jgi:DNA-directed RNA polymerase sigma subunit (sigma70/sigma32)
MQAEYQALSDFSKEAVFVRLLVQELDFMGQQPVVLFCDNTAAIQLAKNQNYQTKTRYIKVAYHIIRDFVKTSRSTSREFGSKKPELYQTKTRYIKVAYHIIRDFVKKSRPTSRELAAKKIRPTH